MNTCVACGELVPEGRHICLGCEAFKPQEYVKVMKKGPTMMIVPGELPDLNQIIEASKQHWGQYSKMKKDETNYVAWIASASIKRHYKKADIEITWCCKNRRKDKDNIMAGTKFILDGLVQAGVIKNDGWANVGDIRHKFRVDKQDPRIEVKITEVAGV